MDPEIEEAVRRDQEEHPGCHYSTAVSSMSSWINGEHKAETLRKVIRDCQGRPPVEIYSKRDTNEGSSSQVPSLPSFGAPQLPGIDAGEIEGMLSDFGRIIQGFGGIFGEGGGGGGPFDIFGGRGGGGGGGMQPWPMPSQPQPSEGRQHYPAPHHYPPGQYPGKHHPSGRAHHHGADVEEV